ncbi:hypothetical protein ABPG74_019769 [Tetrahymena malaccensis]
MLMIYSKRRHPAQARYTRLNCFQTHIGEFGSSLALYIWLGLDVSFYYISNDLMMSVLPYQEQELLKRLQAYILSLKAFEKCFNDYSYNSIPYTIYDLQE